MNRQFAEFLTPEPVLYHSHARGFELFGAGHLVSLALAAVLVVVLVRAYRALPRDDTDGPAPARLRMLRGMAGAAVALIVGKCVSYVVLGLFEPLFWPLHICNLCEFIALGYACAPRSVWGRRLADLLFCWGLTGCLAALLLPGWHSYCPAGTLASMTGFCEHALVFACACCLAMGGDYVPRPQRVWFVLAVTVAFGLLFRVLNPVLRTNFFFVTHPDAVGGPGPWLLATFGDPWFLVPYLLMACALWAAAYLLWRLVARR